MLRVRDRLLKTTLNLIVEGLLERFSLTADFFFFLNISISLNFVQGVPKNIEIKRHI